MAAIQVRTGRGPHGNNLQKEVLNCHCGINQGPNVICPISLYFCFCFLWQRTHPWPNHQISLLPLQRDWEKGIIANSCSKLNSNENKMVNFCFYNMSTCNHKFRYVISLNQLILSFIYVTYNFFTWIMSGFISFIIYVKEL